MMNLMTRVSAPALVSGLLLTSGSFGQVVEERPRNPTEPQNTAILADDDRIATGRAEAGVYRVSEVLSGEARGPGDEGRIAAISDMIMDGEGRPHYVLLSRGGVAGVGGEKIAVPMNVGQLTLNENDNWELRLDMTGDRLDQAPTLEDGSIAQLRDPNWCRANEQFFGAADQGETADDSLLFRASALKDAQVHDSVNDESIANVDDVILGDDFRASHAILGYGGVAGVGKNQVPVPFSILRLTTETDNDRYRLVVGIEATKDQLQADNAPQLDGEYGRLLDPTFIERVETYFGADRAGTAVEPTATPSATPTATPRP